MSRRFARADWPTGSEAYVTANLVAHATPHTATTWTEIDASVAQDCCGLWMASNTVIGVSATNTSMLVELAFGGSGSEVSVVQWYVGGHAIGIPVYLPLRIPAGTRLSGRIQGAVASDIYTPIVILEYAHRGFGFQGYAVAEPIGLNAATSAPTTGDLTDNVYDQAVASSANPYRALTAHFGVNGNAATAATLTLTVGIGGAGSEVALGDGFCRTLATEIMSELIFPGVMGSNIPSGTRLAILKQGTADLTGHLIGWR